MKQTALITGSTSGIGKATAIALARKGWTVIIHGRRSVSSEAVAREISRLTDNPSVYSVAADLSDLTQVRKLAADILERFPRLNVLVLNAGTFSRKRQVTIDGMEQTWVVNYLSRFLLTNLLLDLLTQNQPSRIVDVSGMYHSRGHIHLDDIHLEEGYSLNAANNQAKLANVLWTKTLARKLSGSSVTVNTLHPGAVNTGAILDSEAFSTFAKWIYRMASPFFKSPEEGAETSVFLASSSEAEGISGQYFSDCKQASASKASDDRELQNTLWNLSEDMVIESTSISN